MAKRPKPLTEDPITFEPVNVDDLDASEAVDQLIEQAAAMQASDLCFHPNENNCEVVVRHNGLMKRLALLTLDQGHRLVSYIKSHCGMNLAERRKPQDARWKMTLPNDSVIDLRASLLPSLYGEDLAIRLLLRDTQLRDIEHVGMSAKQHQELEGLLNTPSGLILVTGPNGSGKTTTLYACLKYLVNGERKINTIEDPVEYALAGIRQTPVNERAGCTFSEVLRSVLRQATDVIMVGEIRDAETAQTAVRAANSGHLVFATLHAPTAVGAVQSMLGLGVNNHFLSTALLGVISQRLLRQLCDRTKIPVDLSMAPHTFDEIKHLVSPNERLSMYSPAPDPDGPSSDCDEMGYNGRVGCFEILRLDRKMRDLISKNADSRTLSEHAQKSGMLNFRQAALIKVAEGVTTIEEVMRVVSGEDLDLED
ncbi:Late competence protein ComGA access of DNA to ComEA [Planctomycetales bacterium 10988]|nr:Late competence protein ComGA access of DNA to ComEA [Planctomycetales bacterium 10988]